MRSAALKGSTPWLAWLAVALTVLGLLSCIVVLLPVRDDKSTTVHIPAPVVVLEATLASPTTRQRFPRQWQVTMAQDHLEPFEQDGANLARLRVLILSEMGRARSVNYQTVKMLNRVLDLGGGLLVAQIVAWIFLLKSHPLPAT